MASKFCINYQLKLYLFTSEVGLIAGVATYLKTIAPGLKSLASSGGANAMGIKSQQRQLVKLSKVDGFADGVAVKGWFELLSALSTMC